jgi:ATP synthase protein I
LGEYRYGILLLVCGVIAMSMRNGDEKPPSANDWAGLVLVGQLGLTVAIPILLGIGAGLFVDSKLRSSPIATLIGLLLGLAAGVYGAYRLVSSLE